ncbi:MAG: Gfo/Idh/MocA family oxidoreductase [Candidatus Levybacteria bacterium]|nr:Gfo/Idh/MocA family oxidoreductase [Candidatus Levybacteria bacterium]
MSKDNINVAIVGLGYWGPKLVSKFQSLPNVRVSVLCDLDKDLLKKVEASSGVIGTTEIKKLLDGSIAAVDVVVVATPPKTHFDIARLVLEAGKDVYIEKPMTVTLKEAETLNDLAKKRNKIIFIDHTFCYDDAFKTIRKQFKNGAYGEIVHSRFEWLGARSKAYGPNVLWDSGPHAFSALVYFIDKKPATLQTRILKKIPDTGTISAVKGTVSFEDGSKSEIFLAWNDQEIEGRPVEKAARSILVGSKQSIIYEGSFSTREAKKIKTQSAKNLFQFTDNITSLFKNGEGDDVPEITHNDEPLKEACLALIDAVRNRKDPETNGSLGARVVNFLEKSEESMLNNGKEILL